MDLTASLQLATNLIRAGEGVLLLASITLPDKEQSALAAAKAEAYHAAAGEIAAHLGTLATATTTATAAGPPKPVERRPYSSDGATKFCFRRGMAETGLIDGEKEYAVFDTVNDAWHLKERGNPDLKKMFARDWQLVCYTNGGVTVINAPGPVKTEQEKPLVTVWATEGCAQFKFMLDGYTRQAYDTNNYCARRDGSTWVVHTYPLRARVCSFGSEYHMECLHKSGEVVRHYSNGLFETITMPAAEKKDEPEKEGKRKVPEGWYLDGCVKFHFEHKSGKMCGTDVYQCAKYSVVRRSDEWAVVDNNALKTLEKFPDDHLLVCTTPTGAQRVYTFKSMTPTIRPPAEQKEKEKGKEKKPEEKPADASTPELGESFTLGCKSFHFTELNGRSLVSGPYAGDKYMATVHKGSWRVLRRSDGFITDEVKPDRVLVLGLDGGGEIRCDNQGRRLPDGADKKEWLPQLSVPREKKPEEKPAEKQSGVLPFGADGEAVVTRARSGPCEPIDLPPNCMFYLQHRYQVGVRTVELDHRRYVVTGQHSAFIRITGFGDKMDNSVDYPKDQYELYYYAQ